MPIKLALIFGIPHQALARLFLLFAGQYFFGTLGSCTELYKNLDRCAL